MTKHLFSDIYFDVLNRYEQEKSCHHRAWFHVTALYGENTDNMQKCIFDEAIIANERMCLDDWYMSFITDIIFHQIMRMNSIRGIVNTY